MKDISIRNDLRYEIGRLEIKLAILQWQVIEYQDLSEEIEKKKKEKEELIMYVSDLSQAKQVRQEDNKELNEETVRLQWEIKKLQKQIDMTNDNIAKRQSTYEEITKKLSTKEKELVHRIESLEQAEEEYIKQEEKARIDYIDTVRELRNDKTDTEKQVEQNFKIIEDQKRIIAEQKDLMRQQKEEYEEFNIEYTKLLENLLLQYDK